MTSPQDIEYMRSAIALAKRGWGLVAPNPSVGCVIVNRHDEVVGRARTSDTGRPHAETKALEQAGAQARKGTAYVTLEPCAHDGETPPCAEALIKAGIKRVVIGDIDVDSRTYGKGIKILKSAGVEVEVGVLQKECHALHIGFTKKQTEQRPAITLKTACTNEGQTVREKEKWITGKEARRHVHHERSFYDAILVGVGTVLADNPMLTTRFEGIKHTPVRIVLDSDLKMPTNSNLVKTATEDEPLWIYHNPDRMGDSEFSTAKGINLRPVAPHDLTAVLADMAEQGITRLFVEGGKTVHQSFIDKGYCDELLVYRATKIADGQGKDLFSRANIEKIMCNLGLKHQKTLILGQDLLEKYTPKV